MESIDGLFVRRTLRLEIGKIEERVARAQPTRAPASTGSARRYPYFSPSEIMRAYTSWANGGEMPRRGCVAFATRFKEGPQLVDGMR